MDESLGTAMNWIIMSPLLVLAATLAVVPALHDAPRLAGRHHHDPGRTTPVSRRGRRGR